VAAFAKYLMTVQQHGQRWCDKTLDVPVLRRDASWKGRVMIVPVGAAHHLALATFFVQR